MFDSRLVKTNYQQIETTVKEFTKKCFPNKDKVSVKDLFVLRFEIFLLLQYWEFYRIPQTKPDHISKEDFTKVFISYINIYKNKPILKNLNEGKYNLPGEVSFNEFVTFFWFMNEFSHVKKKIKEKAMDVKELCAAANKITENMADKSKRAVLNEDLMNVFYEILDVNSKIN